MSGFGKIFELVCRPNICRVVANGWCVGAEGEKNIKREREKEVEPLQLMSVYCDNIDCIHSIYLRSSVFLSHATCPIRSHPRSRARTDHATE